MGDLDTTRLLYEGMFRRVAQSYPLDYFWLWTPEGWTWDGVKDEEVTATVEDLRQALAAAQKVKAPFSLATCGWVLGPPQDRTLFDRELPKDVALSCINRTVGHSPVERGFAAVKGRPAWAIPWLEDDPSLTSPQLWVGRMRRDAADARRYGATGLIGIHWRTRVLGPNVQALAQAAWRQDWPQGPQAVEGALGGYPVVRAAGIVAGAADPTVYRDQRCGLTGYRLRVPRGRYTVTLRFAEMERTRAGERVFDVTLEGATSAAGVDLAKSPGAWTAFDPVARDLPVNDGWLDVGFVDHQNVACLAAIEVEGAAVKRRVNVGGPAVAGYEADLTGLPFVPTGDFWRAWAEAELGSEAGPRSRGDLREARQPAPAARHLDRGPGRPRPRRPPVGRGEGRLRVRGRARGPAATRPRRGEPRAIRLLAGELPHHARDGRAAVRVRAPADSRGRDALCACLRRPPAEGRGRARAAARDGPARRARHGAPVWHRQHPRRARHRRELAAARPASGVRAAGPRDRAGPRARAPDRRAPRAVLRGTGATRRADRPPGARGGRAAPPRGDRARVRTGGIGPSRVAADGRRRLDERSVRPRRAAAAGGSAFRRRAPISSTRWRRCRRRARRCASRPPAATPPAPSWCFRRAEERVRRGGRALSTPRIAARPAAGCAGAPRARSLRP